MANKAVELDPLGHVVLDRFEDSDGYPFAFVMTGDVDPYVIAYGYQDDGTWDHGTYNNSFAAAALLWENLRYDFGKNGSLPHMRACPEMKKPPAGSSLMKDA